ncbi:hypothetical protein CCACVL1_28839 [Corchorus capsularis]|uniref:Transmembrane protein adipocyte-associated 1 n=1 Tax=Corchorus capsularis TaxID=210143 RepID=A0A1R3G522_COCAP|nr:hypothetical protein CCACVL1_28839 [Corchorus capsularis]
MPNNIHQIITNSSVSQPPISNINGQDGKSDRQCHGVLYDAVLVVPALLFLVYLALNAKKNVNKLRNGRSYVMISYYSLLWLASGLNLAWCCLQDSYASGLEALSRTFTVSGIIVGVDMLLKAIYIFGFGVPLFFDDVGSSDPMKWGLWIIHKILLSAVYGYILFVHFSKWREKLPPRPAFYNYVIVMFVVNAIALFSCGLAAIGIGFGIWLYNLTVICYHSLYLPFLYITFLAGFFQEEDFLLDNAYYSEMRDAGFFDADWD